MLLPCFTHCQTFVSLCSFVVCCFPVSQESSRSGIDQMCVFVTLYLALPSFCPLYSAFCLCWLGPFMHQQSDLQLFFLQIYFQLGTFFRSDLQLRDDISSSISVSYLYSLSPQMCLWMLFPFKFTSPIPFPLICHS